MYLITNSKRIFIIFSVPFHFFLISDKIKKIHQIYHSAAFKLQYRNFSQSLTETHCIKFTVMKLHFLLLFVLFHQSESRRITGGTKASLGAFPWHVKVEPFDGYTRKLCGGALIKYNWILTAGQCLYDARDVIVRFGIVDRIGHQSAAFWIRNREHLFVHENYTGDWANAIYENDIGMIYLQEATKELLEDPYVDVIAIPQDNSLDLTGK